MRFRSDCDSESTIDPEYLEDFRAKVEVERYLGPELFVPKILCSIVSSYIGGKQLKE